MGRRRGPSRNCAGEKAGGCRDEMPESDQRSVTKRQDEKQGYTAGN